MRLCPFLVSEVEQEIYSDRALPCTHNGFHPLTLTRGVPLDLLLASLGGCFYFVLVLNSVWLCHSSFLTPHSSFNSFFITFTLANTTDSTVDTSQPIGHDSHIPVDPYGLANTNASTTLSIKSVNVDIIKYCIAPLPRSAPSDIIFMPTNT